MAALDDVKSLITRVQRLKVHVVCKQVRNQNSEVWMMHGADNYGLSIRDWKINVF